MTDKRRAERLEHFGDAVLVQGGMRHRGSVFNLSAGGALLALDTEPAEGADGVLEIAGLEPAVPCRVIRDSDAGTHIRFTDAEAAKAVLAALER